MALPISIRMWLLMDTHFLTLSNNNFISFMIYLIYQWSAYDILLYSTHPDVSIKIENILIIIHLCGKCQISLSYCTREI